MVRFNTLFVLALLASACPSATSSSGSGAASGPRAVRAAEPPRGAPDKPEASGQDRAPPIVSRRPSLEALGRALDLGAGAARANAVRVHFLAWSGVNPDTYALKIEDHNRGNRLEIRQLGNPVAVHAVDVAPEKEREAFSSRAFEQWSFTVAAEPGLAAPNGWTVFGQREGSLFRVGLSNGRQSLEFGRVQARGDSSTGTYAATSLSAVYWSPDSRQVVVVVNQRGAAQGWAMDIDEAYGFSL